MSIKVRHGLCPRLTSAPYSEAEVLPVWFVDFKRLEAIGDLFWTVDKCEYLFFVFVLFMMSLTCLHWLCIPAAQWERQNVPVIVLVLQRPRESFAMAMSCGVFICWRNKPWFWTGNKTHKIYCEIRLCNKAMSLSVLGVESPLLATRKSSSLASLRRYVHLGSQFQTQLLADLVTTSPSSTVTRRGSCYLCNDFLKRLVSWQWSRQLVSGVKGRLEDHVGTTDEWMRLKWCCSLNTDGTMAFFSLTGSPLCQTGWLMWCPPPPPSQKKTKQKKPTKSAASSWVTYCGYLVRASWWEVGVGGG